MEKLKDRENRIDTWSFTTEVLSPRQYRELHQKKGIGNIRRVKFIRPRLGENHFGKFKITYKYPTFKPIERK